MLECCEKGTRPRGLYARFTVLIRPFPRRCGRDITEGGFSCQKKTSSETTGALSPPLSAIRPGGLEEEGGRKGMTCNSEGTRKIHQDSGKEPSLESSTLPLATGHDALASIPTKDSGN